MCTENNNETDSTSIANTESWVTDEIDKEEGEVLEIEIDDFDEGHSSDELLLEVCKKKRKNKKSKFRRFFNKILPFRKVIQIYFL